MNTQEWLRSDEVFQFRWKLADPRRPEGALSLEDQRVALLEKFKEDLGVKQMITALMHLPFDGINQDMEKCDAADFVDNAGAFHETMGLARKVLEKIGEL